MKRILSIFLALLMTLSFGAWADDAAPGETSASAGETVTPEAPAAEEDEEEQTEETPAEGETPPADETPAEITPAGEVPSEDSPGETPDETPGTDGGETEDAGDGEEKSDGGETPEGEETEETEEPEETPQEEPEEAPVNVTAWLDRDTALICPGDTGIRLHVYFSDGKSYPVTFASSSTTCVTVSEDGTLRGVRTGKATVTATAEIGMEMITLSCAVTVKAKPNRITLSPAKADMIPGENMILKVSFPNGCGSSYTFTSSDESVVRVDVYGNVYAAGKGAATVTVRSFNGKTAKAVLTVYGPASEVRLDKEEITLGEGMTAKLTASPVDTLYERDSFEYTSDAESIAAVDAEGSITAVGEGETVIRATAVRGGAFAECRVYVRPAPEAVVLDAASVKLGVGNKLDLLSNGFLSCAPADCIADWSIKSSATKYVTVSGTTIKGVRAGKATVTARALNQEGGSEEKTLNVEVKAYPTSMKLNKSSLTLGPGMQAALEAKFNTGAYSQHRFTSSDESVARVDASSGAVTAVAPGKAVVTCACTSGTRKATCTVTVLAAPDIILAQDTEFYGYVGKAGLQVRGVCPEGTLCDFIYETEDDYIAVDPVTGALTLLGEGDAMVTIRANNSEATAACAVHVKPDPAALDLASEQLTIGVGNKFGLGSEAFIFLTPADAETTLSFATSDKKYVTVGATGEIKGVRTGSATITVKTHNGLEKKLKVTVKKYPTSVKLNASALTMGVNTEETLSVSFNSGAYSLYRFTSSDESVVSVDAATGRLYALNPGRATVSCLLNSGSKKASCTVTVLPAPEEIHPAEAEIYGYVGKTGMKAAGRCPATAATQYSYSSSDEGVVKVDAATGALEMIGKGTAVITIRAKNAPVLSAEAVVYVAPAPEGFAEETGSITIGVGNSVDLEAEGLLTLTPDDARTGYTLKSSAKYVKVMGGTDVKGASKGSAVVTAKTHNGLEKKITVTVKNYPSTMKLDKTVLTLGMGLTDKLSVSFNSGAYTLYTFTSSNESVVRVDPESGELTPVAPGTASVVCAAVSGTRKASCAVTVLAAPEEIFPERADLYGYVGKSGMKVAGRCAPSAKASYVYSTSDTDVIDVDPSTGALTLKEEGEAQVTIRAINGGAEAVCRVHVRPDPSAFDPDAITSLTIGVGNSVDLNAEELLALLPAGAQTSYTLSTSSSYYVSVSGSMLKGVHKGSAVVTAKTHNGLEKKITVTVRPYPSTMKLDKTALTLGMGLTDKLNVSLNSGAYTLYTFTSSDEGVVRVDPESGELTPVAPGVANVVCAAQSGTKKASCAVTVLAAPDTIFPEKADLYGYVSKSGMKVAGRCAPTAAAKYVYSTADTDVIDVDEATGALTLKEEGEAQVTIRAINGGAEAVCRVHVRPDPSAFDPDAITSLTIGVGNSVDLNAEELLKLMPAGAQTSYTLSTSSSYYVSVSGSTLKGVRRGSAVVTAKTHNGISHEITVTVLPYPASLTLNVTKLKMVRGETLALEHSFNEGAFSRVRYTSSDPAVASVDPDSGFVTTYTSGTATITCACISGTKAADCVLTVMEPCESFFYDSDVKLIGVGDRLSTRITVAPEGAYDDAVFFSSDPAVACVDADGRISGLSAGTATITAQLACEGGPAASFTIEVREYCEIHPVSCMAHRGASGDYPPGNTLEAFRHAKELGGDTVELDVQKTKDGVIIVRHDKKINGVAVSSLTYAGLKKLESHICTLEEAMACLRECDIDVMIEFKAAGIEKKVLEIVKDAGMHDHISVGSFTASIVDTCRKLDATLPTVYIIDKAATLDGILNNAGCLYDTVSVEQSLLSSDIVTQLHLSGMKVCTWTVNDPDRIAELTAMGVDGICTDYPQRVR